MCIDPKFRNYTVLRPNIVTNYCQGSIYIYSLASISWYVHWYWLHNWTHWFTWRNTNHHSDILVLVNVVSSYSYSNRRKWKLFFSEKLDELDITDKPLDLSSPDNPWPMKNKETLPAIVRLANMFYTTKHVWFPHNGKRSRTPPEDRPREWFLCSMFAFE